MKNVALDFFQTRPKFKSELDFNKNLDSSFNFSVHMIEKLLLNRTHDWSRTRSLQTRLYSLSNSPAVCIILQLIEMMIHCLSRIASLQSVTIVLTALHAAEFLSNLENKDLIPQSKFLPSQS